MQPAQGGTHPAAAPGTAPRREPSSAGLWVFLIVFVLGGLGAAAALVSFYPK